ncbi:hypothetical protein [Yoonia sp. MH D7]
MIRPIAIALVAAVCATASFAQNVSTPDQDGPVIVEAPTYDPTRFLETMVSYRTLALTCEDILPGSPLADSAEISMFFQTLGMAEPLGVDARLQRLTKKLVRAQGASICAERLQRSALEYGRSASNYSQNKPEAWPNAPRISAGPWCASLSCSELSF